MRPATAAPADLARPHPPLAWARAGTSASHVYRFTEGTSALPERIHITDLQPNQLIEGVYAIQNCQLGHTKSGKPYIRCLIADRTGRTPGRMWNATEELYKTLPPNGFIYMEGETQPYQGELQVIIRNMREHEPTDGELRELLPSTPHDVDQMFAEVVRHLEKIEQPAIRTLAEAYLSDGPLMDKFCQAPAAQTLHHAYLGGLLEHTLTLMRIADQVLPIYPQLNPDLVKFGLFLHDLGKCGELTWQRGFGYSTDGQLVGHIVRGSLWLEDKANWCAQNSTPIPEPILRSLHHIILSHHQQPEFGALKIPAMPEAWAVSLIDNLDAKLHMALTAARQGDGPDANADLGGEFTEKVWALGTRLYRPDPTTVEE